jgi:hypothetical protein
VCEARSPAVLLFADAALVCHARFSGSTRDEVFLHIPDRFRDPAIRPLTVCCVSFNWATRARVFLEPVVDVVPDTDGLRAIVRMPQEIVTTESRFSFRVPIVDAGLRATVRMGEESVRADVVDVSLTGAQIEFAKDEDPDFELDRVFDVELSLDNSRATQRATVRRRRGHSYGLFFENVLHRGRIVAPDDLVELVRCAEQRWLQQRTGE